MTAKALSDAAEYDMSTYGTENHVSWIELLACLAAKNGGDFSTYQSKDLNAITAELKNGEILSELTTSLKYYNYYFEAYSAVLGGMIGEYYTTDTNSDGTVKYGITVRSPIARGYYFSHYDDFGATRSYGYRREHLGHDLIGSLGTPIVAVESGYVEAVGWNQYGGWRIGIRSFDGKRYYYYAHLRKNHPFNDIYEGKIVEAGEVIGYLGMTGYSTKENVNNIETPHLHLGLQIIFDESQKDGTNQIWIDLYELTKFLQSYTSTVKYDANTREYYTKDPIFSLNTPS